jgi:hypothetical protein
LICDLQLNDAGTISDESSIANRRSQIENLLNRPAEQRLREYKYRFSQSVVFGVPVIGLHVWGSALGPVDAQRWASLFGALLAGWVVYVNLGMLFEGVLRLRERVTGEFIVALVAAMLYLVSLVSAVYGIVTARVWYPLLFHFCVIVLAAWTGMQWLRHARHRPD